MLLSVLGAFLAVAIAAWLYLLPPSLQVSTAAIAGCDATDEEWLSSGDELFEGLKFWEIPLFHTYRVRERLFPRLVVSDYLAESTTSLHLLIMSADAYPNACEPEILSMFEHYLDRGTAVNF